MSQLNDPTEALERVKEKSDDNYEKNLVYIAAGTLVLSLTFIEKVVEIETSNGIWFLVVSWILLTITLIINLISHQLSSVYHSNTIDLYNETTVKKIDSEYPHEIIYEYRDEGNQRLFESKLELWNRTINCLNWCSTYLLIFGISFLVTFCSINAINKSSNNINIKVNTETMAKQDKSQGSGNGQKGRTITIRQKPSQGQSGSAGSSNNSSSGSKK